MENKENNPRRKGLTEWCQLHHFRKGTIITGIIVITFIVLTVGVYFSQSLLVTSKTVELGFRNIGELATQEAFFTNIQTVEKARELLGVTIPFTDSKYVFSYDGVIKAGYDFSKIELVPDNEAKTITVYMPQVQILSLELIEDSLVVYNQDESIYTPLRIEDVNSAVAELKDEAKNKAIKNGLLINARNNAEVLISNFLLGSFDEDNIYTIIFVHEDVDI